MWRESESRMIKDIILHASPPIAAGIARHLRRWLDCFGADPSQDQAGKVAEGELGFPASFFLEAMASS